MAGTLRSLLPSPGRSRGVGVGRSGGRCLFHMPSVASSTLKPLRATLKKMLWSYCLFSFPWKVAMLPEETVLKPAPSLCLREDTLTKQNVHVVMLTNAVSGSINVCIHLRNGFYTCHYPTPKEWERGVTPCAFLVSVHLAVWYNNGTKP